MHHTALSCLIRSSRQLLCGLAAAAAVAACAANPGADSAGSERPAAGATSQSVLGVPGPSPYSFERVGVYVSPANTSGYSFSDPLSGPAGLVSQLGTRVIRIFLSNPDKYTGVQYASLGAQVLTWPYTALFNSSSFDTYLLTTYSRADLPSNECAPNWLHGYSGADAQAETAEIQQLALDLAVWYPSKKFIIMNWEGDSAIGSLGHPPCNIAQTDTMWQGFTAWINARVQGVLDARSQGAANVYSGLEFSAVQRLPGDDFYGNACGPPDASSLTPGCSWCDGTNSCVISRVVPGVPNVDYLSYSSWQSLAVPDDGDVAARLQNDLSRAQGFAPGASRASFIVGELGIDRFQFGEARAASRMSSAISGLTGWGASYGVYWQVLDNSGGEPGNGFGAWEPSGTTGAVGNMLRGYFGQPVTCSFSAASSIPFNGSWSVAVTSNPAGYSASWYGAHNGAVDAIDAFAGTTNLFQTYGPYTSSGDWYTRGLILRDGGGNTVCTTNTVTVSIQ